MSSLHMLKSPPTAPWTCLWSLRRASRGSFQWSFWASSSLQAPRVFPGRQSRRCFHHPKPAGQCTGSSCSARCDFARDLRAVSRKKSGDHPAGSMFLRFWCLFLGPWSCLCCEFCPSLSSRYFCIFRFTAFVLLLSAFWLVAVGHLLLT